MATNDDLKMLNSAMVRVGAGTIPSFENPGPVGTMPQIIYENVRDDLLSKYPWHFTHRFAELSRKGSAPNSFTYEFHLPAGRLALPRAYYQSANDDIPYRRFQLSEKTVYANCETLFADFQIRPEVAHWPPYFGELLRLVVAAELAGAVREDWKLRDKLRLNAYGSEMYQGEGGQFGVATDLDAMAQGNDGIDANNTPIMQAHQIDGVELDDWD